MTTTTLTTVIHANCGCGFTGNVEAGTKHANQTGHSLTILGEIRSNKEKAKMNPNLKRDECYLRNGNKMFFPVENGERKLDKEFVSGDTVRGIGITQAKRYSRTLMKQGKTIVTKG